MKTPNVLLPLLVTCLAAPVAAQGDVIPGSHARPPADTEPEELLAGSGLRLEHGLSIRELMTEPLVQAAADGRAWVRTRDLRASLGADGLTVYPVFGSQSPREWPVRFDVTSVTRGDVSLGGVPVRAPEATSARLELARSGMREVYNLGLDEIEQTFVFDELAGTGDLVVRLDVETDLTVVDGGDQLRFVHDSFGEVTYGRAFVVDAAGARQEIERTWTGSGIELRVPDAFLARAALPVTIDPLVGSFSNGYGAPDDASPDITFCGQTNEYLVCWQEYTSADNSDVYLTKFNSSGQNQGSSIAIDTSTQYWDDPRIAYAYGPDRALIVASVNPDDLGGVNSSVRGVFVDVGAFEIAGATKTISTVGWDKKFVDVGGTNHDALINSYFCVVWSRDMANGNSRIEYRVVDWDGSSVTDITLVTDDSHNDVQTTISAGLGDVYTGAGSYWTIAWIQDDDKDGRGQVMARRIVWHGDPNYGDGNFLVQGAATCANPTVTSQFDEKLEEHDNCPSIVAYDRRFTSNDHPTGYVRSIFAHVIVHGEALGSINVSYTLEDFDPWLDQWGPSIATDGRGFFLSYCEEWWSGIGSANWDMYMMMGNIADRGHSVQLALSERHQQLAATVEPDSQGRICTIWAGEADSFSDDGACVWVEDINATNGFGQIHGYTFDAPTFDAGDHKAVGTQYCDAHPTSVGTFGGRTSSWLSVIGDGTVGSAHAATCVDMPQNQFGYLLASTSTGNIDKPGGSEGRLCVGGNIGRYVAQVANSGATGIIATTIDPQSIPQPTGPVFAIPGETWHFQLWHRDIVNAIPTSNFSNACLVVFKP